MADKERVAEYWIYQWGLTKDRCETFGPFTTLLAATSGARAEGWLDFRVLTTYKKYVAEYREVD